MGNFQEAKIQMHLLMTASDFPNPAYPFSFLFGKFIRININRVQRVQSIFLNVETLFDQM